MKKIVKEIKQKIVKEIKTKNCKRDKNKKIHETLFTISYRGQVDILTFCAPLISSIMSIQFCNVYNAVC